MAFEQAGGFLSIVTQKYGLQEQAQACLICERVRHLIQKEYADFSFRWVPHKFENGVLFIEVIDAASSAELFLKTHHLLELFQENQVEMIQDIRIQRKQRNSETQ